MSGETAMTRHPILPQCRGEACGICGRQAHHKVGEEILGGQAALEDTGVGLAPGPLLAGATLRHNLTAYLCCPCFRLVMGGAGTSWCGPKAWDRAAAVRNIRDHEFTFILSGADGPLGMETADALFEAGCADATLACREGVPHLSFNREADTIGDAIRSANRDVNSAGLRVASVIVGARTRPLADWVRDDPSPTHPRGELTMGIVSDLDGCTIYYCSGRSDWSDIPCGPDCPGIDHVRARVPDARLTLLRLVNALRIAWANLGMGDGPDAMEHLRHAYVAATDHDIEA